MKNDIKGKFLTYLLPCGLLIILGVTMLTYRLSVLPPLWFDEGWSLTVAKNWVETGQYARLLEGNPISAIVIAKPFSVTGPIALSFSLFGIGIWQGRLPAVLSTVMAIFALFVLARKIYSLKTVYILLFVLLFMAPPSIHPFIIGRQAIAEAPMMFYLMVGYICLLYSLQGNKIAILGGIILFGLALDSKGHVLPFWLISMVIPIIIAYKNKQFHQIKVFTIICLGSLPIYLLLSMIQRLLFSPYPIYDHLIQGFFSLGVFVTFPETRLVTLENICLLGIPTILGIVHGFSQSIRKIRSIQGILPTDYIQISILSLLISWFAWYLFLSLGWSRYLYPIWFLVCIFLANMIDEYLLNARRLLSGEYKQKPILRAKVYAFLLFVLLAIGINYVFMKFQLNQGSSFLYETVNFINQNIGPDELIETYESELLFQLDHPFHYPPDQIQIDLNKRYFLKQEIDVMYDPLNTDFHYLIDGPYSKMWKLYTPIIEKGKLLLIYESGDYTIYKRLR